MRLLIQELGVEGRTFDEMTEGELIKLGTGRFPQGAKNEHEGYFTVAMMKARNYTNTKKDFELLHELKGHTTAEVTMKWRELYLKWTGNHKKVYDIQNARAITLLGEAIRELTTWCQEEGTRILDRDYANNFA